MKEIWQQSVLELESELRWQGTAHDASNLQNCCSASCVLGCGVCVSRYLNCPQQQPRQSFDIQTAPVQQNTWLAGQERQARRRAA